MASFHVMAGADDHLVRPAIRKISLSDVFDALRLGWRDFARKPSHYVFLCLMYPVAGFFLAAWSAGADMLPVIYPLVTGFALLGPFAALGLYEISRRNEQGLDD